MSFNAAALQLMLDKGLSLGDVVEIAAANEKRSDSTAAERKRRQRERERDMSRCDVTRDPSPNERDNLTPTREEKPEPKGSVKKADLGTRLPLDWEPKPLVGKTAEMVAVWPAGMIERELAKFKDHWLKTPGARGRSLDWDASYRNWLRTADERKPRNERPDKAPIAEAYNRVFGQC